MSALYYCRQTTTACKGIPYPSKAHPYKYGTGGCVYTSGCGVCTSLMALRNSTNRVFNTRQWTHRCLGMGARAAEGTDMAVVARYMKEKYGLDYAITTDMDRLVAHLKQGYKAIINVSGGGKMLFSNSGHYVLAAGIDKNGNLIILDPYWYDGKFTLTAARRKYTRVKNGREVYVRPADLKGDVLSLWLFTPKRDVRLAYSTHDIHYRKSAPTPPTVKPGTYHLTAVRGIYKGAGAASGRKTVGKLTENGKAHATASNPKADAYLKKGTAVTLTDIRLLSTGNLWGHCPSGWLCIWEKQGNKTFIK